MNQSIDLVAIIVGTLGGVFVIVLIIIGAILYKKYKVVQKDIKETSELELSDALGNFKFFFSQILFCDFDLENELNVIQSKRGVRYTSSRLSSSFQKSIKSLSNI